VSAAATSGDYVSLATVQYPTAPRPAVPATVAGSQRQHHQRQLQQQQQQVQQHRRSTPDHEEDVTHIHETPKYVRREKAATMKMHIGGNRTQYFENVPNGCDDDDEDDDVRYDSIVKCSRSTTLPRDVALSSTANGR
jgi:hypothetical protein